MLCHTKWLPSRLWGSKKAPWSDTGNDLRDGILIWFKAKYTNYIELVREGENYIWLKLKKKDLSSNTQYIFLWTSYIPPIEPPYFKDQTITNPIGAHRKRPKTAEEAFYKNSVLLPSTIMMCHGK